MFGLVFPCHNKGLTERTQIRERNHVSKKNKNFILDLAMK